MKTKQLERIAKDLSVQIVTGQSAAQEMARQYPKFRPVMDRVFEETVREIYNEGGMAAPTPKSARRTVVKLGVVCIGAGAAYLIWKDAQLRDERRQQAHRRQVLRDLPDDDA